jgi:CRP/FNR family transcriptional regulator, cyclic AMP receptor protein
MQPILEQLRQISIFTSLTDDILEKLRSQARLRSYSAGEIVMYEHDHLPHRLYALAAGRVRISKTASTGKETILRVVPTGEMFAAPALFGNGIAPATVTAETNCDVITVDREALLDAIRFHPEIALSMLSLFNQRLQQLHNTVHGLVSERAIARLARYIQYFAHEYGTEATPKGDILKSKLTYYQIARSIGITYEECVRLFKQLQPIVAYNRGGKITVTDWQKLDAIASGIDP